MSRKDWLWILVKGFGIYAGLQALETIPPIFSSVWLLQKTSSTTAGLQAVPLWQQILTLLLLANVSFYLLGSGRLIHWLAEGSTAAPENP